MTVLPPSGEDRITPEIKEHLIDTIALVKPLSRDFRYGLQFGVVAQSDFQGGGLLEAILMRMGSEAPDYSDLFYLGAVLGSIAMKDASEDS